MLNIFNQWCRRVEYDLSCEIEEVYALDTESSSYADDLSPDSIYYTVLTAGIVGFGVVSGLIPYKSYVKPDPENEAIDLSPDEVNRLQAELQGGKKLALVLMSDSDETLVRIGDVRYPADFADVDNYVMAKETFSSTDEMLNYIRDYAAAGKKIDTLIIQGHGFQYGTHIKGIEYLTVFNADNIFEGYGQLLEKDAEVLLVSCGTGTGSYNIAYKVAEALDRDVYAPVRPLLISSGDDLLTQNADGDIVFDTEDYIGAKLATLEIDKQTQTRFNIMVPKSVKAENMIVR